MNDYQKCLKIFTHHQKGLKYMQRYFHDFRIAHCHDITQVLLDEILGGVGHCKHGMNESFQSQAIIALPPFQGHFLTVKNGQTLFPVIPQIMHIIIVTGWFKKHIHHLVYFYKLKTYVLLAGAYFLCIFVYFLIFLCNFKLIT